MIVNLNKYSTFNCFSTSGNPQRQEWKKRASHSRLVGFIHQHQGTAPLSRVYFKSPLIALCQAYAVRTSSRSTKLVIAQDLLNVILEHAFIPNTIPVDDRQFRIVRNSESEGHIRILFQRGKLYILNGHLRVQFLLVQKLSNHSYYLNRKQKQYSVKSQRISYF